MYTERGIRSLSNTAKTVLARLLFSAGLCIVTHREDEGGRGYDVKGFHHSSSPPYS